MKLLIRNARLRFVHLHKPKSFTSMDAEGNPVVGEPKYSVTALLDVDKCKAQIAMLESGIKELSEEFWAKGVPRSFKSPLHDGNLKDHDGYENTMFVNTNNTTPPLLLNRDRSVITGDGIVFYDGCYGNVSVNLWIQNNKWGKGVNLSLRGAQFVSDGESLGNRASVDEFEELGEEQDITD